MMVSASAIPSAGARVSGQGRNRARNDKVARLAGALQYACVDQARVAMLGRAEAVRPAHDCSIDRFEDVERQPRERNAARAQHGQIAALEQRWNR